MQKQLLRELVHLRDQVSRFERDYSEKLTGLHSHYRYSAINLLHYLALRQHDLRALQEQLAILGLSSLGRAESHVMVNLDTVCKSLHQLLGLEDSAPECPDRRVGLLEGKSLLKEHTDHLFGPEPLTRMVRIMVTMSTEAASDPDLVRQLVESGMDCMRINCAHDHPGVWAGMIANLKSACAATAKRCVVLMDLAGPKLRTGALELTPAVIKWRPKRDDHGRLVRSARLWLTPVEGSEGAPEHADASLKMPRQWLESLNPGDTVRFFDARDAARTLTVTEARGSHHWAECAQTAYVAADTVFQICRASRTSDQSSLEHSARIASVPQSAKPLMLKKGDSLHLTKALVPGRPATYSSDGTLLTPATIGITLPQIFADVRAGEPIWFDDGKIGGIITQVDADILTVEITQARDGGEKLAADKGINLPESQLRLPALTEEDVANLSFIAANADIVGYSFVQSEDDLIQLQGKLKELGRDNIGIILKIETKRGFENLPELILAAMRSPSVGVMIARGDLAVECGYERLAEVQEEILWISEAAHVPVIWATQVLEHLAKSGTPSRAEVTDAAMGERAECVMLNKGPHIVDAVRLLDNVLQRMAAHQDKKSAQLRQLHLVDRFTKSTLMPA
jgi:pyruvate kinase